MNNSLVPPLHQHLTRTNPCRLLPSGSLVLLSPGNEDEGYFECTAVNEAGEERRVIEVILQGMDLKLKAGSRVSFQVGKVISEPFCFFSPTVH